MPATEKTWRDLKTMHVVFGCSGLIMLVATVWMFAADHQREWKKYQRKMRSVDVRFTDWRLEAEKTAEMNEKQSELETQLVEALTVAPDMALLDQFAGIMAAEEDSNENANGAAQRLRELYQNIDAGGDDIQVKRQHREELMASLDKILQDAKFEEDNLLSKRKFASADYDERRANFDLAVRDDKTQLFEPLQKLVDQERAKRENLTAQYHAASSKRKQLQSVIDQMNAEVDRLSKEIADSQAEYDRLNTSRQERNATFFTSRPPFLGKRVLEFPIADAFNSPLKIDNLWTENLTIDNGSFGAVTRYDRCTTCHQAISRTAPGSAVDPLYEHEHELVFELVLPEASPAGAGEADEESATLWTEYGIELASQGLIAMDDVTIRRIKPGSPASRLRLLSGKAGTSDGLQVGDVVLAVNGDQVLFAGQAKNYLLNNADWGATVELRVRRGLPHPFSSHPRLDLFVGSLSPHNVSVFGCTICHEGQGSSTSFKWASHTPNDQDQQAEWMRKYGWFNNHHWIYPMNPNRFAESSCLKCHHEVVELKLTDRFETTPAPKLTRGHELILSYGCYGCHEINGYDGAERVGPDIRLEPNYSAGAAQVKSDPRFAELSGDQRSWINQVIQHPSRTEVRHKLLQFLRDDNASDDPKLSNVSHDQIAVLSDVEHPGKLRKAGPSLRHVAGKVGEQWLYDWIKNPTDFRPSTRMPRFFGHLKHLDPDEQKLTKKFEPIEIQGLVTYLLTESQPQEFISEPDGIVDTGQDEQVARGKRLFETRGCLACHQHDDFPFATATQGPNLSNIGDKFAPADTPDPQRWMYTWLRNPMLYHPRTKMPDLMLEVIENPDATKTDPAADIAAFLLASRKGWEPSQTPEVNTEHLDELLMEYLKTKMSKKDAETTLTTKRMPEFIAANVTGAETLLSGDVTTEKKLMYIGNKTISKYGCYGCHDIPGFENAKPIGTAMAEWGRKESSKLAFEHIAEYLSHGHGHQGAGHGDEHGDDAHGDDGVSIDTGGTMASGAAEDKEFKEFYRDRILEHDRVGFIWQKLKEPRSYDFRKARNKDSFNDRLRMPLFPFDAEEREAVITFVLGLVAEPPAYEFLYYPNEQRQAVIEGHAVLDKYNCGGCHIVDPERWSIEFEPDTFTEQGANPAEAFPFMRPQVPSDEVAASLKPDPWRERLRARLAGMPTIDRDGLHVVYDEEGDPIEPDGEYDPSTLLYSFDLWKPTLLEGHPYEVGLNPLELSARMITHKQPTFGGDLTHWLLPRVVEIQREAEPQADGKQAYGWLPPPLIGEGKKVQSAWLHDFLLNPYPIRPATFMRMPKFNMSSAEATALARYFAVKDGADFPYEYSPNTETRELDQLNQAYESRVADEESTTEESGSNVRLEHAMNIVTSGDYCVKCHLVADYDPGGSIRAKAPDLSVVYERLRPDYVRRWIARPPQLLPYTPMPVNIQFNADAPNLGGVNQQLFHGTSIEQLDGVVDLLMNYPRYSKQRAPVSGLVKPATIPDGAAPGDAGEGAE